MKLISTLLLAAFCLIPLQSESATITSSQRIQDGQKISSITLKGKVVRGDAANFEEVVRSEVNQGAIVIGVNTFSRGGDWAEALKIGRLIRKFGMFTASPFHVSFSVPGSQGQTPINISYNSCTIIKWPNGKINLDDSFKYDLVLKKGDPDCECTSACAIIWAGGFARTGQRVGFHRPYISPQKIKGMPFSQAEKVQEKLYQETASYMAEMGFSEDISVKMLSKSSREIYYFNAQELATYSMDPGVDEWLIGQCPPSYSDRQHQLYKKLKSKKNRSEVEEELVNMIDIKINHDRTCSFKAFNRLRLDKQTVLK